ncbi:hypothetical protein SAMN05421548_1171, partial [Paraburkholderia lycopersici]
MNDIPASSSAPDRPASATVPRRPRAGRLSRVPETGIAPLDEETLRRLEKTWETRPGWRG